MALRQVSQHFPSSLLLPLHPFRHSGQKPGVAADLSFSHLHSQPGSILVAHLSQLLTTSTTLPRSGLPPLPPLWPSLPLSVLPAASADINSLRETHQWLFMACGIKPLASFYPPVQWAYTSLRALALAVPSAWNAPPRNICLAPSLTSFRSLHECHSYREAFPDLSPLLCLLPYLDFVPSIAPSVCIY